MKYAIFIGFIIVTLGIIVFGNIYLVKRFTLFFSLERSRGLYFLFGGLSVYMIAALILFTNSSGWAASLLYGLATLVMGFMLYIFLSTLLVDLLRLFIKTKALYYGWAAIGLCIAVMVYGMWNAATIRVSHVEVPIKGLDREIRAVHFTDVHLGHNRGSAYLQKIVDKINDLEPDVVFLTGDLFNAKACRTAENIAPLKQLRAPLYFASGNHDYYAGLDEVFALLNEAGVHVMDNRTEQFGPLQIVGLVHMRADENGADMHARHGTQSIQAMLDSLKPGPGKPSILLHHSPDGIKYAEAHGIDLYLAGHTHAGQLFPINLIAALMFDYNRGLHEYGSSKIFVSQGVGTFGPPMRIGTVSEIALITLKPGNE